MSRPLTYIYELIRKLCPREDHAKVHAGQFERFTTLLKDSPEQALLEMEELTSDVLAIQNKRGQSLLHIAIFYANRNKNDAQKYGTYQRIISGMVDRGADVNLGDTRGISPFMFAGRFLLVEVVERFLQEPSLEAEKPAKSGHTLFQMLNSYRESDRVQEVRNMLRSPSRTTRRSFKRTD